MRYFKKRFVWLMILVVGKFQWHLVGTLAVLSEHMCKGTETGE